MNRVIAYDLLKGIGILLVLWGHTDLPESIKNVIYVFHMPLFFFASGVFYKEGISILNLVKKRAVKLLLPWLFFVIVLTIIYSLLEYRLSHDIKSVIDTNFIQLIDGIKGIETSKMFYQSIWFLICLFEVNIFYTLTRKMSKNEPAVTCCCLGCYGGYLLQQTGVNIPYFLDTTLSVLIFYHIGYCFIKYQLNTKLPSKRVPALLLISAILICYLLQPNIDFKDNIFVWYTVIMASIIILSLTYILLGISSSTKGYFTSVVMYIIATLGIESIILLGFHRVFYYTLPSFFMTHGFTKMIFSINEKYALGCFMVILTAFCCVLFSKLIHKCFPKIFGKHFRYDFKQLRFGVVKQI